MVVEIKSQNNFSADYRTIYRLYSKQLKQDAVKEITLSGIDLAQAHRELNQTI